MKNLINILVVTFTLCCSSCADLDIASDGRVSLNDIFNRYERTSAYYSNCLGYMPQVGFTYENTNTPLASFCDEAHDANDNQDGPVSKWYKGYTTPEYNPLTASYMDPWSHYFEGIRRCNTFLLCINDPEMATYTFNEVEKNGWIAEVRVARAFYYLQLIKRYGGVPLIETPYETNHDFSIDKRASFEECADFIISECDKALATVESEGQSIGFRWQINDNERGKLTRAFACAVKSQTALYAASPLWNENGSSKYTWEKTTEITKEALDLCLQHGFELYSQAPDPAIAQNAYAYYFITRSDPSRSWDRETIYETTSWRSNVWKFAGTPITKGMEKAGAGPSQELIDSYEMIDGTQPILGYSDAEHLRPILNTASSYDPKNPYANRDPRFYASVYYNGAIRYLDQPNGDVVETYVGGNCGISDKVTDIRYTRTGYYMRKFNNFKSGIGQDADGLMRIFRLAELYLNFAEAAYQAVGPDGQVASKVGAEALSARDAVNKIRVRAGIPALSSGMSKDSFEKRYRNERRVELAFEEHRFFDVRRWKILNETDDFVTGMKIVKEEDGTFTYNRIKLASRGTNADKYLLYPIKQTEVAKMLKHTGANWQNPGW
ncbi:RagB/SusD family nutrient uptake outer membrane protein [Parabacteroides goldsteinii]|uniref:RagB/SusD family nutrient uptake outer membrane protein n=1 Tax=Parabacteroides goldsteinii TaxID=328812 RepID=UPI001CCFB18E|nr:RagB/SusD family nutrient uptake outer membrane protein [Parabacteroides goldsteinii]UBD74995.1 RagB/SusD family nutrient uptake outer membrane protein [Parabacteroides goldsteinii]